MSRTLKLLRAFYSLLRHRVDNRPDLAKILGNMGWLFMDNVLRMGVGLLVGVWLARYLGPEQFGQLSYAIAFVGLFGALAGLGLNGVVVRNVVRDPDATNATLGTAFALQVLVTPFVVGLVVAAIWWMRPDDPLTRTMVIILSLTLVFMTTEVVKAWFESQVQARYTVWVENGIFVLMAAIKVAMILRHASLLAFVWLTLVESALVAVGLVVVYSMQGGQVRAWQLRSARAKALLRDSWPLMLAGLAVMIYTRIDQIMLGEMLGAPEVGNYTVAVKISELWYFLPVIIGNSIFPSTVEAKLRSEKLYYQRLQSAFNLMVLVSVAIALPVALMSGWIVNLLYGDDYKAAGAILAINVWAGVFVSLGIASSYWLLSENLQILNFYRTIVGAFVNIILNYLLIPKYGTQGAAFATLVSYAYVALFSDLFSSKTRAVFRMKLRALLLFDCVKSIRHSISRVERVNIETGRIEEDTMQGTIEKDKRP